MVPPSPPSAEPFPAPALSDGGRPSSSPSATAPSSLTEVAGAPAPPLEDALCPLCREPGAGSPRYRFPPFGVVTCRVCGLDFLHPRPPEGELLDLYADAAYFEGRAETEDGYGDYRGQATALRRTFRRLLRELARRGMTGGALLDVGCAYGYLLDEARAYFATRDGCDLSVEAAQEARRHADRVVVGGAGDLPPGSGLYRLVTAIQVIEHVYDALPFVEELVGRLTPGGHLLLATPDMGSPWRRVLGHRWPSFKIPEHVAYYDRDSLGRLLRRAGLRDVTPLPYPHAFPAQVVAAKLGWTEERLNRLSPALARTLSEIDLWIPGTTLALAARKP